MAATGTASAESAAAPPVARIAASPSVAYQAGAPSGVTDAILTSAVAPARHRRRVRTTTVRPGEGFWTIAARTHVDWHALAAANGMTLETMLYPGQVLRLPQPGQAAAAGGAEPSSSAGGTNVPSSPAGVTNQPSPASSVPAYTGPTSSFEACVIGRESGGDPEVMNGSGHWGLYQFSESLWVAYGGSAAGFGNAPAGVQQEVFHQTVAAGGASNWSAYDGC